MSPVPVVLLYILSLDYYSSSFMEKQDFTVGAHFELFCIGLQLMIIFILDPSADYFLHWSIDRLLCNNSENSEKWRHDEPEPKVTPSQCLLCPTNSPKLNIIKTHSHDSNHSKEKQQIFTSEKLQPGNDFTGKMSPTIITRVQLHVLSVHSLINDWCCQLDKLLEFHLEPNFTF